MSRLLGAAYGVFCVVLLAPPLALMRAGRDEENRRVSLGRKCTHMHLLRRIKLFGGDTISPGWNVQREEDADGAAGISSFLCRVIMEFLQVHFR